MRFQKLGLMLACALLVCVCAFVRTLKISAFQGFQGERTFYLYSLSSQSQVKRTLSLSDMDDIKGESITLDEKVDLESVLEKYDAYIIMEEICEKTTSYYCYSLRLHESVIIGGNPVNLHIAIGEDTTTLGTPIIFGGF